MTEFELKALELLSEISDRLQKLTIQIKEVEKDTTLSAAILEEIRDCTNVIAFDISRGNN